MTRGRTIRPVGNVQGKRPVLDDRYMLRVLSTWSFDSYEFVDAPNGEPDRITCHIIWNAEGLECSVIVELNTKQQEQNAHVANPIWRVPGSQFRVPTDASALFVSWTERSMMAVDPVNAPKATYFEAPFELLSRKVHFWPVTQMICLQQPVAFDLGLRNAITHCARKLRAKGVQW